MNVPSRFPLACAGALALAALAGPVAAAAQDPVPVTPNSYFGAVINGQPVSSTTLPPLIKVICPGPITPGETGHPLEGQTVEVDSLAGVADAAPVGFTGSAGTQIDAGLTSPSGAAANLLVFKAYFAPAEIPTAWNVPCGGTGTFSFVPLPTSLTARTLNITVEFGDVAS